MINLTYLPVEQLISRDCSSVAREIDGKLNKKFITCDEVVKI